MAEEFVELCYQGDLEGVQAALQSGTDVNCKNEYGRTGLMEALSGRKTGVARLLLEQEGIDINNCDSYGQSALHYAARFTKNSECLAILLARPELTSQMVNKKDSFGDTPLWWAVYNGAVECVQLLINDTRTDPNIKGGGGDSPLMFAIKKNYVGCVGVLLPDPRVDLMTRDAYDAVSDLVVKPFPRRSEIQDQ